MCFLHIRYYVLQHKLSLYKYFKCSFFKEGSLCKSCFFHQQILLCVQFCVRLLFFRFCFVHFVYELLLVNIFPIFFMIPKYIGSPVTCSVSLYFFTIFSHCTEKSGQSASSFIPFLPQEQFRLHLIYPWLHCRLHLQGIL